MELELEKRQFECYQPYSTLTITREETSETIVPDYNPDISRIVAISSCLLLRSRSMTDNKLTVSGTVKVTLLYVAESMQELQTMEYSIPFDHSFDGTIPQNCEEAVVEGHIRSAEARMLNPRKIFTRLDLEWKATPYCPSTLVVCGAITKQSDYSIETMCEDQDVSLIRSVSEKDFVFSETLTLPGGREAIKNLLCSTVKLRVSEAKCIGSKVILKGIARISVLYTAENGSLYSYAEDLPFSQILEGISEESNDISISAILNMSDCEIYSGGDGNDGRSVSIKLFLSAFLTLRQTQTVCCITDLYSTACELETETETITLSSAPEYETVTENIREQLDTGTEVRSVLTADVCFGGIAIKQNDDRVLLQASATVSALYIDESGVPLTVNRQVDITSEVITSGGVQVGIQNASIGDISTNINANGLELRFPVQFLIVSSSQHSCESLMRLCAEHMKEREPNAPSLVLRSVDDSKRLWDIAKQYRTTVQEILSANELADGIAVKPGQMLLIPRKR